MPRKPRHPAEKAARALLRGKVGQHCSTPAAALETAIPEEEWNALLDGHALRYMSASRRKARAAVRSRHPMRQREA